MTLRYASGQPMEPADVVAMSVVDSVNTAWLRALVARSGWPKRSVVGEEGAHDAWLLVQHADRDTAFQNEVLGLMEDAVAADEASGSDFAYLTDRVRIAQGRPQLYGTQARMSPDGELEPYPIEDSTRVDERRPAVGLPPLAEYLERMKQLYGPATSPPVDTSASTSVGFQGIYTVTYYVPDIARATEWYSRAFGIAPYFEEPYYVGFDVAGYELGLQPEEGDSGAGPGGVIAYWGVADADEALAWLLSIGAAPHAAVQDVGGGVRTASVLDPFGNVVGIIENPQFGATRP
jgi:predicted enzyme related to lactoylglutathione lyase